MPLSESIQVTAGLLRNWPLPAVSGSKNQRGRILVIGGSVETVGAVVLAGEAALRAGAGKLQVATVESRAAQVAVALPEALVRPLSQTEQGGIVPSSSDRIVDLAEAADAVLLGPGMTGQAETRELVEKLSPHLRGSVVLDALALTYMAAGDVLTPNVEELAIALGVETKDVESDVVAATCELARRTGSVVHGGGELSVTAAPDGRCWLDDHGAAGLGVSGSGDVLAGVTAGLLARGAEPIQATVWAAHVHAEAGNRLVARVGEVGFLAREIAAEIAPALRQIG
ncbi:MAG: NAD(P)H-hydrate dehydratase [Acidothermaceae bacterium]